MVCTWKKLHFIRIVRSRIVYGSHNKQPLFSKTAFSNWFSQRPRSVFPMRQELSVYVNLLLKAINFLKLKSVSLGIRMFFRRLCTNLVDWQSSFSITRITPIFLIILPSKAIIYFNVVPILNVDVLTEFLINLSYFRNNTCLDQNRRCTRMSTRRTYKLILQV